MTKDNVRNPQNTGKNKAKEKCAMIITYKNVTGTWQGCCKFNSIGKKFNSILTSSIQFNVQSSSIEGSSKNIG